MDTNNHPVAVALTPALRQILNEDVNFDKREAVENCKFMWDTVSGLIRVMCDNDPLFNEVYSHLVHAGSFYEGLRVASPDEFDLQVVLLFPFTTDSFDISIPNVKSPFVTYRLHDSPQQFLYRNYKWRYPYKILAKFIDKDGFLSSHKVLRWVHGVIEKALESYNFTTPKTVCQITRTPQSSSCPAFTLEITGAYSDNTISVDLVPVLNISGSKIPRKMRKSKRFRQLLREKVVEWFLVPKPPKDKTNSKSQNWWRSTFPSSEKSLLADTGCLKDMIKIFKRLRDLNETWKKPIYSYSIKAFFMKEFDDRPDLNYWNKNNLGRIFLQMLESFRGAMTERFIPDYFHPEANMLVDVSVEVTHSVSCRIDQILHIVCDNPNNVKSVFNPHFKKASDEGDALEHVNWSVTTVNTRAVETTCLDSILGCCIS